VAWTLKNPTKQPVLVDLRAGATRVARLLEAGGTASGVWKGPCAPQSSPLRSKVGLVLQYRYGCDTAVSVPRLGLVRPVRREMALDKRALEQEANLEAIAKVWSQHPGSRLVDVQLQAIDEVLRKRAEDGAAISGRVSGAERGSSDKTTPIKVELRNSSPRDLTVIFDVGTGRDERMLVPKKSSAEIRYELPAGANADLKIRGVMPKLRSADWLVGHWSFQGTQLVILPTDKGLAAFAIDPVAGDDETPRVHPLQLDLQPSEALLTATLPGWFAVALFTDKAPAACEHQCQVQLRAKFAEQDQYIVGAGRVLAVEVVVPGRSGSFKLSADF
jgi:hypothetical protein